MVSNIVEVFMHFSGADPGFCVRGDEIQRGGGGVLKAFLAATLKHFKDVINLI